MKLYIFLNAILVSYVATAQQRCFDLFTLSFNESALEIAKFEYTLKLDATTAQNGLRRDLELPHLNLQKRELIENFSSKMSRTEAIRQYNEILKTLILGSQDAERIQEQKENDSQKKIAESQEQLAIIENVRGLLSRPADLEKLFKTWIDQNEKKHFALLIDGGFKEAWPQIAKSAFSDNRTADWKDLYAKLIEEGDPTTLQVLALDVFAKPHTQNMGDLLLKLIERNDERTLQIIALFVFSQKHTETMSAAARALIQKADYLLLEYIVNGLFTKNHSRHMLPEFKLLVEKVEHNSAARLKQCLLDPAYVWYQSPVYEPFKSALEISDLVKRKLYLDSMQGYWE